MTLPVVVIEVGPPGAQPRYPAELSAACSDAVRRGRCAVTGQGPPEPHPAAVAIVSWGGRELSVRVQVGVQRAPGTRWLVRDMQFKDADAPVERWRAVGLTIATLVGELPSYSTAPAPAPAPAVTAKPPAVVARRPSPPRRGRRWWLEAGALLGPGLASGSPRGGGYAGAAYLFGDLPLLAHVSLGYAARPADFRGLSVQFLTLQAGVGAHLVLAPADFELDGRLGVSLERVTASATRDGATDGGSRLLPAWHLGGNVVWPARGFIGLLAGADAWAFESPTRITIEGESVGQVPGAGVVGRLGLRLRLH